MVACGTRSRRTTYRSSTKWRELERALRGHARVSRALRSPRAISATSRRRASCSTTAGSRAATAPTSPMATSTSPDGEGHHHPRGRTPIRTRSRNRSRRSPASARAASRRSARPIRSRTERLIVMAERRRPTPIRAPNWSRRARGRHRNRRLGGRRHRAGAAARRAENLERQGGGAPRRGAVRDRRTDVKQHGVWLQIARLALSSAGPHGHGFPAPDRDMLYAGWFTSCSRSASVRLDRALVLPTLRAALDRDARTLARPVSRSPASGHCRRARRLPKATP